MAKREYVVNSVLKALDILEILDENTELGVSEIARMLNMEKSTVYRLVNSLRIRGYIQQNIKNQKYLIGFKLYEIGNNVVGNMGLKKQAYPFLKELSMKTGEGVNIALRDGKHIVYLDKIETQTTIKVNLVVGKEMPVYCTGLGKIFLAYLAEDSVKDLLRDEIFERFTPQTHQNLSSLLEELRTIRQQGFAWDNEEYVEGLICVAAPVFGRGGKVIAALSTALPKFRYELHQDKLQTVKDHVLEVSNKFTKAILGTE